MSGGEVTARDGSEPPQYQFPHNNTTLACVKRCPMITFTLFFPCTTLLSILHDFSLHHDISRKSRLSPFPLPTSKADLRSSSAREDRMVTEVANTFWRSLPSQRTADHAPAALLPCATCFVVEGAHAALHVLVADHVDCAGHDEEGVQCLVAESEPRSIEDNNCCRGASTKLVQSGLNLMQRVITKLQQPRPLQVYAFMWWRTG